MSRHEPGVPRRREPTAVLRGHHVVPAPVRDPHRYAGGQLGRKAVQEGRLGEEQGRPRPVATLQERHCHRSPERGAGEHVRATARLKQGGVPSHAPFEVRGVHRRSHRIEVAGEELRLAPARTAFEAVNEVHANRHRLSAVRLPVRSSGPRLPPGARRHAPRLTPPPPRRIR